MLIGHYAVSYAVKSKQPHIPLWQLFLAVQFVDILFFTLSFFGIERFAIVPNYTASTHFQLLYLPYSHGLAATFVWGLLTYGLFRWLDRDKPKAYALGLAIGVVSHWFLDLIVHTSDLPLLGDDSMKVGFGLWNYNVLTFLLETILLAGGAWLFAGDKVAPKVKRRTLGFVAGMVAMNAINVFGPASDHMQPWVLAVTALVLYFGLAWIAYWTADHQSLVTDPRS